MNLTLNLPPATDYKTLLHLPKKEIDNLLQATIELACSTNPLLREFCGRRYSNLANYGMAYFRQWLSAMWVALETSEGKSLNEKMRNLEKDLRDNPRVATSFASVKSNVGTSVSIMQSGFPFFAIDKGLLSDLLSMEPSHDWNIAHECLLPFEGFAFLLPHGVFSQNGIPIVMLSVSMGETSDGGRVLLTNAHRADTVVLHARSLVADDGTVLFDHTIENFDKYELDDKTTILSDIETLAASNYLAMAILSTLNSSPDNLVQGVMGAQPVLFGSPVKARKRDFWTAPVITAERLVRGKAPAGSSGHRRAHLRRAHWHTVLHGTGRALRKRVRYPESWVSECPGKISSSPVGDGGV